MFFNNIKMAFRNLVRRKLYTVINILGLTIGLAGCLLIIGYVNNELTFESCHEYKDRIYRVDGFYGIRDSQVSMASIMPALIFSTSGIALDYEVHFFFCPAGARWSLKGELEKLGQPKGLPDPIYLFNTLLDMAKKVTLCELALENKGIDPKDVRDERIVIEKLPPFLMDAEGATMTYVF